MDQDNDIDHYRRRERIERELAAACIDPRIRDIHLALAEGYADRVAKLANPHLTVIARQ